MKAGFFIFSILLLSYKDIRACSCIGTATVKNAIKNSDLVISGKVLSKSIVYSPTASSNYRLGMIYYKFLLSSKFKGRLSSDTVTIVTGQGGGDCGVVFEIGKQYIIYGQSELHMGYGEIKRYRNTYQTDICTRTQLLDDRELTAIRQYCNEKKRKRP